MTNNAFRPRLRRWAIRLLVLIIIMVIAGELVARFALGLGDPPLYVSDPQIEYRMKPSRTYDRFGNRVSINEWSMRSDEFPKRKSQPNEYRVLVFGDSVVNGGALADQSNIITEILKVALQTRLQPPIVVGNISAGSWGPANLLAYAEKFGLFEADAVIIVLSSHDFADAPTFEALGTDTPERAPVLALQEAVMRYLPRYLPDSWRAGPAANAPAAPAADSPETARSLAALTELIQLAQQSGAKVAVAQHLKRAETMDNSDLGHEAIATTAAAAGADVIQLGPAFEQARRAGSDPYRDDIHPNEEGNAVIAAVLRDWILAHTRPPDAKLPE